MAKPQPQDDLHLKPIRVTGNTLKWCFVEAPPVREPGAHPLHRAILWGERGGSCLQELPAGGGPGPEMHLM